MIGLRELRVDTGERTTPPAERFNLDDEPGDELDTTAGLVAAVDHEIESANTAADETTPPGASDHALAPASGSDEPAAPARQPKAKSYVGQFLERISLTSAILGFVLAVIMGAVSWSGLNSANSYAKQSYDLALYQACRTYEVRSLLG